MCLLLGRKSNRFRNHLNGVTRAFRDTQSAPGAVLVLNTETQAHSELIDRAFRANRKALVALETISAG